MKNKLPWIAAGLMLAFTAHANQASHVHASVAWIRLLPADLPAGAYVTLSNDAAQPTALVGATSSRYASVMLHQSTDKGGMARMSKVAQITIPAHGSAQLSPGHYHLMLMRANAPVQVNQTVPLTLKFADGSTLQVPFMARPANAMGAGDGE